MKCRHLLLASALAFAISSPALADTIDDPLHGYIVQNGVNTNTDNGTIAPAALADPTVTGFGFFASPAPQTGSLSIAVLIPTNETPMLSVPITGTFAGTASPHAGTWTSGDLATFLGFANASPSNPFSAFASADAADPNGTPTGFEVLLFTASAATLQDISLSTMLEHIGGLPAGAEIAGFLVRADGTTVSTAPSGVLEVTPFAVPGPVAGAGLPGLIAAGLGLLGLHKRRRRNATA